MPTIFCYCYHQYYWQQNKFHGQLSGMRKIFFYNFRQAFRIGFKNLKNTLSCLLLRMQITMSSWGWTACLLDGVSRQGPGIWYFSEAALFYKGRSLLHWNRCSQDWKSVELGIKAPRCHIFKNSWLTVHICISWSVLCCYIDQKYLLKAPKWLLAFGLAYRIVDLGAFKRHSWANLKLL